MGASELGISFLQRLVFCPHLRFNNLTLVSTTGLPGSLPPDNLRESMRIKTMNYDSQDLAAISLRSWVNIITGKMTWIDRRRKVILINGHTQLPYDHLILCTGEQYYNIAPLNAKIYNPYTKHEVKSHPTRILFDQPPQNMFVINNEVEAENLLRFMQMFKIEANSENILLYGMDLNSLCAMQAMIQYGIDPNRFIVVCQNNVRIFLNLSVKIDIVLKALISVLVCFKTL